MTNNRDKAGFTLVELSIVIIIIGLLIAGVSAGVSLIQQARLNSFINELSTYDIAIKNFREKYNYLPGDLPNASAFFGASCLGPCNGNGNGIIDSFINSATEDLEAWQHLSLSGLITKKLTYTGDLTVRVSAPQTVLANESGFWILSGPVSGHAIPTYQVYASFITVGTRSPSWPFLNMGALTPVDAASIDTKIDDGRAGTGSLRVVPGTNGFCTDRTNIDFNYQDAQFLFNDHTTSCSLVYIQSLDDRIG